MILENQRIEIFTEVYYCYYGNWLLKQKCKFTPLRHL